MIYRGERKRTGKSTQTSWQYIWVHRCSNCIDGRQSKDRERNSELANPRNTFGQYFGLTEVAIVSMLSQAEREREREREKRERELAIPH